MSIKCIVCEDDIRVGYDFACMQCEVRYCTPCWQSKVKASNGDTSCCYCRQRTVYNIGFIREKLLAKQSNNHVKPHVPVAPIVPVAAVAPIINNTKCCGITYKGLQCTNKFKVEINGKKFCQVHCKKYEKQILHQPNAQPVEDDY